MRTLVFWGLFVLVTLLAQGCGGKDVVFVTVGTDASALEAGAGDAGQDGTVRPEEGGTTTGYTIGGTVTGLEGAGLQLANGTETLAITASGPFTFHTRVARGATYDVKVSKQPAGPTQTCTVTGGAGKASADVTSVAVTCVTRKLTIGGTVAGLDGTGLVLENNGGDSLAVGASGSFTFPTPVASGGAFSVTVQTQPSGPTQTCVVTGGTGTVGGANVTSVLVNCATDTFAVGGQVSGLAGGTVVLEDNGGDDLTVSANGTFAFPTALASGASYAVTVLTQPSSPSQTCTVSNGTGTVGGASVTGVSVTCTTKSYTVGGTVSGVTGTGLVLQDNLGDNLTVSASGSFTFPTPVASGGAYSVTVLTQPTGPSQTCTVTGGTGTVDAASVTTVAVSCTTNSYTIGGSVSGLTGSGLVLALNGGGNLSVAANGVFSFPVPLASGATYTVTVGTQPTSPVQTCTVSGGTGTLGGANVTSVSVNCATNRYTIGGQISGLVGTVVLQDNGGDNLSVTTNGTFAFTTPVASGATFSVKVLTQPGAPSQTCVVAAGTGTGTVVASNITTVSVTCTTNRFTVGGTVSGLPAAGAGTGVVLLDNGGDNLTITKNGAFTFATSLLSGTTYSVTVTTQPTGPSQTCAVTVGTGAGTVGAANVTTVSVTCATNTYAVGGTLSGLAGGSVVLQDNLGNNLPVNANGPFTFTAHIASGAAYSVTTLQNPTTPPQTCVVTNGTGTVTNAPITSVTVTCTANAAVPVITTNQFTGAAAGSCTSAASTTCTPQATWEATFSAYVASATAGASICYSTSGAAPSCTAGVCGNGSIQTAGGAAVPIPITTNTTSLQVLGCAAGLAPSTPSSFNFALHATKPTVTCGATAAVVLSTAAADLSAGGPTDNACVCYEAGLAAPTCPGTCASSGAVTCFSSGSSGTTAGPTFSDNTSVVQMISCKPGFASTTAFQLCP